MREYDEIKTALRSGLFAPRSNTVHILTAAKHKMPGPGATHDVLLGEVWFQGNVKSNSCFRRVKNNEETE